jgi:hypothetical protein
MVRGSFQGVLEFGSVLQQESSSVAVQGPVEQYPH